MAAIVMSFSAVITRSLKAVQQSIIVFWYCVGGILLCSLFLIGELIILGIPNRFATYTMR